MIDACFLIGKKKYSLRSLEKKKNLYISNTYFANSSSLASSSVSEPRELPFGVEQLLLKVTLLLSLSALVNFDAVPWKNTPE